MDPPQSANSGQEEENGYNVNKIKCRGQARRRTRRGTTTTAVGRGKHWSGSRTVAVAAEHILRRTLRDGVSHDRPTTTTHTPLNGKYFESYFAHKLYYHRLRVVVVVVSEDR